MEIIRYVNKNLLNKFYIDKNDIGLLSRALLEPIIDKKKDIYIDIPIKIIIPDIDMPIKIIIPDKKHKEHKEKKEERRI